jgi:hypothetical protein
MGLRDKIRSLEKQAGPLRGTLRLPDGREVSYEHEELLEALLAVMEGREHRLLPYLRQMPSTEGIPGIIRALERSEHAS